MIYFVTGTDTDAGKTVVTAGLLQAAAGASLGLKPIAAGCDQTQEGLCNQDALMLMAASSIKLDYQQVNPIALQPAIAPHIAAMEVQQPLSLQALADALPNDAMQQAGLCLVEGAGGWRLPLNHQQTLPQWVQQHNWPVILVVGMKLGCLNHALLTAEAIRADGLRIAGWIANGINPQMERHQANLETLQAMLGAPMLAQVPHLAENETAAAYLTQAAAQLEAGM